MRSLLQRYLWMIGLALIGAGFYLRADLRADRAGPAIIVLGFSTIILNLYLGIDRRNRTEYLRNVRYGTNALFSAGLLLTVLVLVNLISFRFLNTQWDVTAGGEYTLHPETVRVLGQLKNPVLITGFHKTNNRLVRQEFDDLMEKYKEASSGRITWRLVDPDQNPEIARQYDEKIRYGTVCMEIQRGEDRRFGCSDSPNEERLVNALIILSREKDKTICYLQGHGEKDTEDFANPYGFGQARTVTEQISFFVEEVNLLTVADIPGHCSAVVLAGPTQPFEAQSVDTLTRYLDRGGRAIFLLDPDPRDELGLDGFALRFNLALGRDIVIDEKNRLAGNNPAFPVIEQYEAPPMSATTPWTMTKGLDLPSFFPMIQSIRPVPKSPQPGVETWPFLRSTPDSYGETDLIAFSRDQQYQKGPNDHPGPLTLGMGVIRRFEIADKPVEQRCVFLGDSDFASNQMAHGGNMQLYANLLNWVAQDEELINYDLHRIKPQLLSLTDRDIRITRLLTAWGLPLLGVLAGVIVYLSRRRL